MPEPPDSLVSDRKQAPDARCALDSAFCPEKQANSIPPSLSVFVTASSPLAFGPKKCAKAAQFPSSGGLRSSQGFPRHDSQPRTWLGTRQPAEVLACDTSARRTCHPLSLEGVSQMDSILPDRLLALVRPGNDLVLRRIRNLKRCAQACGCNITTPRYACNLAPGCISSEPTFAGPRKKTKQKRKQGVPKHG